MQGKRLFQAWIQSPIFLNLPGADVGAGLFSYEPHTSQEVKITEGMESLRGNDTELVKASYFQKGVKKIIV